MPRETTGLHDLVGELLHAGDPKVRREAAVALARKREPASFDGLVRALADKDAWVQKEVVDALVSIGAPAVPRIVSALGHGTSYMKVAVVRALTKIGEEKSIAALLQLTEDPSSEVHHAAFRGLRANSPRLDAQQIAYLARRVRSCPCDVRNHVVGILEQHGWHPDGVGESIIQFIVHQRWSALKALGKTALDFLERDAGNPRNPDRASSVSTMGRLGVVAVDTLLRMLEGSDSFLRTEAGRALRGFKDPEAIDALEKALASGSQTLRVAARGISRDKGIPSDDLEGKRRRLEKKLRRARERAPLLARLAESHPQKSA